MTDPAAWNRAKVPLDLVAIIGVASVRFGASIPAIRGESRARDIVDVRRAIVLEAQRAGFNWTTIGRALNRDRTTVMHLAKTA